MTPPIRGLLLRSGRSSVKSCVRAGGMSEPGLTTDALAVYDRMADEVTWPDQLANQGYLAVMVLPVAALYKTLRERGWAQQEAADAVRAAFLATGARQRSFFKLLLRTDLGRRLFLRSLRPNWLWLTPPPTNQWSVIERSSTRVTIEITRCYRLDAFRLVGTPEVASVACAYEEYVMNGSPDLRVTTSTMAAGADTCRSCFERLDPREKRGVPAGERPPSMKDAQQSVGGRPEHATAPGSSTRRARLRVGGQPGVVPAEEGFPSFEIAQIETNPLQHANRG